MTKKRLEKSIYLTEQSASQLGELVTWLKDRIDEMAVEEEWMENEGLQILSLLRGLSAYLQAEHLEEEVEEEEDYVEDEEAEGEIDFDEF